MSQADEINKLYDLKIKGLITDDEFEKTKQKILNPAQQTFNQPSETTPVYNQKSRVVYLILAFFFGMLGIHNFYAGRTGHAIAQLLITLLLWWIFIPLIVVWIWIIVDMCTIKTDGENKPMQPTSTIVVALIIILQLLPVFSIFIGCASGLTTIFDSYQTVAVTKAAERYAKKVYEQQKINRSATIPSITELGLKESTDCQISIPSNGVSVSSVRVDFDCSKNPKLAEAVAAEFNEPVINGKISHRFEIK